jgi:hypothetical protein
MSAEIDTATVLRDMIREAVAEMAAQQSAPAAPAAPVPCGCQHHHPTPAPAAPRSLARPLAVGGAVAVTGCVLTGLFLAVALTAVAVAVGGVVVLFLLREYRKGGVR